MVAGKIRCVFDEIISEEQKKVARTKNDLCWLSCKVLVCPLMITTIVDGAERACTIIFWWLSKKKRQVNFFKIVDMTKRLNWLIIN